MKIVVDAHKAIGAEASGFAAQAKIHSRNNVGRSGKIYFATKQGYPAQEESRDKYPGGYPMVYDPATGETKVYPIPVPHHGVISFTPDERRGLGYVSTCDDARPSESTHFLVLDLETGEYQDLLDCEHMYAFIVVDYQGRAYHPIRGGDIARYEPRKRQLVRLKQTIDGAPPAADSYLATEHGHPINWDISPDRKTLYAQPMSGNALYAYDLTQDAPETLNGRFLGKLLPNAEKTDCRGMCVGPTGTVWCAVTEQVKGKHQLHLVSYRPGDTAPRDHGRIHIANPDFTEFTGQDGKRLPYHAGFEKLEDGRFVTQYVNMGVCEAQDGSVYLLAIHPYTLLKVPADSLLAAWPPELPSAKNGVATVADKSFLTVPEAVQESRTQDGAAPFVVAQSPPTVTLAYHQQLGESAIRRRLWSSWGDICVASDGRVYMGIGDHGNDRDGDARCFVYCWDPQQQRLDQVVDMNKVSPPRDGHPSWSKIHAKIDEGPDGAIYFSCTLNDGNRAGNDDYRFDSTLPGGQLYRYAPATSVTSVFADLPSRRCTATSLLDRQRGIWWCNLEAGDGNALWGFNMRAGKPLHETPDGTIGFNRNFALLRDGSILFNGENSLATYDAATKQVSVLQASLGDSPGMRCSTGETQGGHVYGITHKTHQLFSFSAATTEVTALGPNWLNGSYTAVCELSPDERFVYYLPGSHGGAFRDGTPVVQYEIATGQRKVLAFLAETLERECGYVPGGTYGMKISADGGTLYVNFNGHAADS
ncbi:MAG: hypothetical protein KDA59_01005, partial [Planctomycetales bacterium]|nr:hypothetical protein [Planctomycetales bacterium]